MFFGEPSDEKIEPAHAALRADASPPAGPVLDKFFVTDQMDDFVIRSIFQQATHCPILIEPSLCAAAFEDLAELVPVEVIIPDVGKTLCWLHVSIYTRKSIQAGDALVAKELTRRKTSIGRAGRACLLIHICASAVDGRIPGAAALQTHRPSDQPVSSPLYYKRSRSSIAGLTSTLRECIPVRPGDRGGNCCY